MSQEPTAAGALAHEQHQAGGGILCADSTHITPVEPVAVKRRRGVRAFSLERALRPKDSSVTSLPA
jgi:hypothetical protein